MSEPLIDQNDPHQAHAVLWGRKHVSFRGIHVSPSTNRGDIFPLRLSVSGKFPLLPFSDTVVIFDTWHHSSFPRQWPKGSDLEGNERINYNIQNILNLQI